jgi:23S rRNA pseudouridine1911/1915/1917 synthase
LGRSTGHRWLEYRVLPADEGRTVGQILRGPMGVSGRMLQRLTRSQGFRLNRKRTHLDRTVSAGDVVAVRVSAGESPGLTPVSMPLRIVHEDDELLVLDKPSGVLVHPTRPEHRETLAHGIAAHFERSGVRTKVRPVHRLDRDTTGLWLVAKTAFAHQRLDRQLREGGIRREYLAIVEGVMEGEEGTIDLPIGRAPGSSHLRAVRPDGNPARTRYEVAERLNGATLLRLRLETGRTHQIRVHLAHSGHPVVGDRQYGARPSPEAISRYALHSWRLEFRHPVLDEPIVLEAPLPPDMDRLLDRLRA